MFNRESSGCHAHIYPNEYMHVFVVADDIPEVVLPGVLREDTD